MYFPFLLKGKQELKLIDLQKMDCPPIVQCNVDTLTFKIRR